MKCYIFDSKTKEYVGEDSAFWEPIGAQFLIPPNGTLIPPHPAVPKNCTQVFNKSMDRWNIIPDFRGREVFDIETQQFATVTELGELPETHFIVDTETKEEYLRQPKYFEITPNGLQKKTSEIALERSKQQKRDIRNAMLSDFDWRIQRALDAKILGQSCSDKHEKLVSYRQYLRDFTQQDNWWERQPLSFEEFMVNQEGK